MAGALLYPVKNSQLHPHLIRVCTTKMNAFCCIDKHYQVQCFNPIRVTALQKHKQELDWSNKLVITVFWIPNWSVSVIWQHTGNSGHIFDRDMYSKYYIHNWHKGKYLGIIRSIFVDCSPFNSFPICSNSPVTDKGFFAAYIPLFVTSGVLVTFRIVSLSK